MIPRGARSNGMAYWQRRVAEGRERSRRPRSAAEEQEHGFAAATDRSNGGAAGASGDRDGHSGSGGGGGVTEGSEGSGSGGQWEDEKEEVQYRLRRASVLLFEFSCCRSPTHRLIFRGLLQSFRPTQGAVRAPCAAEPGRQSLDQLRCFSTRACL